MHAESLAEELEREHREIDECIRAFTAAPGDREPLTHAIRALRRHIYLEEEFSSSRSCTRPSRTWRLCYRSH